MDVKTTFLCGDLDETILMQKLNVSKIKGKKNWECYLKRSLYGLNKSPRKWYWRFNSFMFKHNYIKIN